MPLSLSSNAFSLPFLLTSELRPRGRSYFLYCAVSFFSLLPQYKALFYVGGKDTHTHTHTRTHALTHSRTHCGNQFSEFVHTFQTVLSAIHQRTESLWNGKLTSLSFLLAGFVWWLRGVKTLFDVSAVILLQTKTLCLILSQEVHGFSLSWCSWKGVYQAAQLLPGQNPSTVSKLTPLYPIPTL